MTTLPRPVIYLSQASRAYPSAWNQLEAFAADKKTINAVIRSLEVLGEAAKRIPANVRKKYPQIPWKRMAGMRDKLIHEYAGVDIEIVWGVVREELPPLVPRIEKIVRDTDAAV